MNSKRISVEPTLLLYTISIQITELVDVNLLLQKHCHPDLHGQPDPTLTCDDEISAQKVITNINTWKPIIESIIASLFIIFIGQWSDTHGKRRKPMLIIPIFGEIICLLLLIVSVFFWSLSPELTALLTVCRSFTGGFSCVLAGCIIYISDITTEEERTIRVGMVESMLLLGLPVGMYLAGFLRTRINFYGTYLVCILIDMAALLLTVRLVKNNDADKTELKVLQGVFYPKNIIDSFKVLVKNREDFRRLVLILTFLVTPVFMISQSGENSVWYLYARYKFKMDEEQYSHFASSRRLALIVGSIPMIIVFFVIFKVTDTVFGVISCVTQIISGICNALAQTQNQLLVVTLLEPVRGVVIVTSRSLLTKVVEPHELGRITSLQTAFETLIPIFAVPMYSRFYQLTFEFIAGAFFLLNSCIAVVLLLLFVIVVFIKRKQKQDVNAMPASDSKLSTRDDVLL